MRTNLQILQHLVTVRFLILGLVITAFGCGDASNGPEQKSFATVKMSYPNGKPKFEYSLNAFKEYEGHYLKYNELGILTWDAIYEKGKKNGVAKSYFDDGTLDSQFEYAEDSLHGPFRENHPSGKLKKRGTYSNGKFIGNLEAFYPSGAIQEYSFYSFDEGLILSREYDESGTIKEEIGLGAYAICESDTVLNLGDVFRVTTVFAQPPGCTVDIKIGKEEKGKFIAEKTIANVKESPHYFAKEMNEKGPYIWMAKVEIKDEKSGYVKKQELKVRVEVK